MSNRKLEDGTWYNIRTEAEHGNLLRYGKLSGGDFHARCQRGDWCGPGRYLLISYTERCPRNCCDDFVRELIPAKEIESEARAHIQFFAQMLKDAKNS